MQTNASVYLKWPLKIGGADCTVLRCELSHVGDNYIRVRARQSNYFSRFIIPWERIAYIEVDDGA